MDLRADPSVSAGSTPRQLLSDDSIHKLQCAVQALEIVCADLSLKRGYRDLEQPLHERLDPGVGTQHALLGLPRPTERKSVVHLLLDFLQAVFGLHLSVGR